MRTPSPYTDALNGLYAAEKAIWSYTHRIAQYSVEPKVDDKRGRMTPQQVEALLASTEDVDIPTAAKCLDVTEAHVRRLIAEKYLFPTKRNRPMRVSSRSVHAYLHR